jgi:hypothetical protein
VTIPDAVLIQFDLLRMSKISKHVHVEDCNKCVKICASSWSLAKVMEVFVSSGYKPKILHWQKSGFSFANIHSQPLQLLYSSGISKLPGVASVVQTK